MKNIYIILLMIFSLGSPHLFSQESDYNVPFSILKEKKEAYFKEQVNLYGDKILEGEGSEYRDYQRWLSFWQPRIAPHGTYESYSDAIFEYQKQTTGTRQAGNLDPWFELGPYKKPSYGIPSNGGGDLGVGIIHDMVINRQNVNKLLAWSVAGGLYFTNDKGLNWTNAGSDKWPRSGCSSAAFDPYDQNLWYGCSNIGGSYYPNSIGTGGGVFRTDNAGASWVLVGNENDLGGSQNTINKILVHPNYPAVVFVATTNGLYKGINVNDLTNTTIYWQLVHTGHIEDIEFKTDFSATLIITTKNVSNVWTVEYTPDSGASWTTLTSPGTSFTTDKYIIEVSDAAPNAVYLWQKTPSYSVNNLFVYDFTTSTWTLKSAQPWQTGGPGFCVSNFNSSIIYLGNGIGFSKSTDGGANFIVHGISPSATNQIHPDVDKIITAPGTCGTCTDEVYFGTHGGVSFSNDAAATVYTRGEGLGIAYGWASTSATDPSKVMIGLDHDGTVLSSGMFGANWIPNWHTVYGGDGMPPLIDYSDANYTWAAPQQSIHMLSSTGGSAGTYTQITNIPISNSFAPHVHQNKVVPNVLYSPGNTNQSPYLYENLFRSNSRGVVSIPEQLTDFQNINIPAIGWPDNLVHNFWMFNIYPTVDPNITYVPLSTNGHLNTWYGKLYKNVSMLSSATAVKNSWVELPIPPGKQDHGFIGMDASNAHLLYLGYTLPSWSGLDVELLKADYTNTNAPTYINIAGKSISGGLPKGIPFREVLTEKGSNGGIYVATDVGIFYSNNTMLDFTAANNSQWIKLGTNLPNVPLFTMEITYLANKLRVSTGGRGLWEHDLYCPSNVNLNFSGVQSTSAFHEAIDYITSIATIASGSNITYRAGTNVTLNPGFIATPSSSNYFHAFIHPCSYPGNSPGLREDEEDDSFEFLNKLSGGLKIYPNPGTGVFTLELEKEANAKVSVYDAHGKQIHSMQQVFQKSVIDLTGNPKGMYFVKVVGAEISISGKIILE